MKKAPEKKKLELFHFNNGSMVSGKHDRLSGDCTGLYGDCTRLSGVCSSRLSGNCSGISGDCTGLFGHCTGLYGDLDDCEITKEKREAGINIFDLIKDFDEQ